MSENEVKIITTFRNVMIRISAFNKIHVDNETLGLKAGDTMQYTKEDIKRILDDWAKNKKFSYYFVEHNEDLNNIHFHIVLRFASPTAFAQIKKVIPLGDVQGIKYGSKNAVQYLIHLNNPEKAQYDWEDIETNNQAEMETYKIVDNETTKLKHIIDEILQGNIKEFEIEKIDSKLYLKHTKKIKTAFEYRNRILLSEQNREIDVYVCQGPSGTGKTTYAKEWAKKHGKSYCISSAGNDAWQDYAGQTAWILDDFSIVKNITINDLLKMLDPYNNTSVSSRYRNKYFIGDTIFICTNTHSENWFENELPEHRRALYRRIKAVIKFEHTSEPYVSRYTVNKVVVNEYEEPKNVTDANGNYLYKSLPMMLKRVDDNVCKFDLRKYVNIEEAHNDSKYIADLEDM